MRLVIGRRWMFLIGLALGAAGGWAAQSLWYVNWREATTPVDLSLLLIREDAKGDGRFGAPRSGNRSHRGVDIEAPVGTPVRAVRSGMVIATGMHRGLGRYVQLEHAQNLRSLYAHLETVSVEVGDHVRQGEPIATVGKTGNAKSPVIKPHLHFEVSRDGRVIDPSSLGLSFVQGTAPVDGAQAEGGE